MWFKPLQDRKTFQWIWKMFSNQKIHKINLLKEPK